MGEIVQGFNAQLALDGTEVPPSSVVPRRLSPSLTPAQRDVLRHIGENGFITPKDAGMILFSHVEPTQYHIDLRSRYASADGSEMLRRLALRGLVHKEVRGRWVAGPGERPSLRRSELGRRP